MAFPVLRTTCHPPAGSPGIRLPFPAFPRDPTLHCPWVEGQRSRRGSPAHPGSLQCPLFHQLYSVFSKSLFQFPNIAFYFQICCNMSSNLTKKVFSPVWIPWRGGMRPGLCLKDFPPSVHAHGFAPARARPCGLRSFDSRLSCTRCSGNFSGGDILTVQTLPAVAADFSTVTRLVMTSSPVKNPPTHCPCVAPQVSSCLGLTEA